mmetsp:Transcript_15919/g.23465  ORF Transcript_15919/g.23465 Transcript_15919/m.23465 type:complete len:232 (+) Transcript_15919:1156-1851(+)
MTHAFPSFPRGLPCAGGILILSIPLHPIDSRFSSKSFVLNSNAMFVIYNAGKSSGPELLPAFWSSSRLLLLISAVLSFAFESQSSNFGFFLSSTFSFLPGDGFDAPSATDLPFPSSLVRNFASFFPFTALLSLVLEESMFEDDFFSTFTTLFDSSPSFCIESFSSSTFSPSSLDSSLSSLSLSSCFIAKSSIVVTRVNSPISSSSISASDVGMSSSFSPFSGSSCAGKSIF